MNNDYDYLAKKIAEETVNRQKEAYNRKLYLVWKITLIFATFITGLFCLPFMLIFPTAVIPFIIILFITIRYCKKHPKV